MVSATQSDVKVVILAGGLGTRLSEETASRQPKPLVEIGGRPILWHIMKSILHYGFNEFVICLATRATSSRTTSLTIACIPRDFTVDLRDDNRSGPRGSAEPWRVTLVDTGARP